MNSTTQREIDLTIVLDLIPHLDTNLSDAKEMTLGEFVRQNEEKITGGDPEHAEIFKILKEAVEGNKSYQDIVLVDVSATNGTKDWTDDLIQACTFRDADGNYYVTYRGTGNGRWADNGDGMTQQSTEMQEAAKDYFDQMAEEYLIEAKKNGKRVIVAGHSKGGNEAQYVYMASDYEGLIDNCYSYDGQGFSKKAIAWFKEKYGEAYEEKLSRMYSICGENDYVHDLGHVIIPDENTYFVETSGSGFVSLHDMRYMLTDDDGNYTGLQWNWENGTITHGEQGPVGKLAKRISEELMKLDEESLHDTAVALMYLFDLATNGGSIGNVDVNWEDYADLLTQGIPAIFQIIPSPKEGVDSFVEYLHEEFGYGGDVAAFIIECFLEISGVSDMLDKTELALKVIDLVLTGIDKLFDLIERMELPEKMKEFIFAIKDYAKKYIQEIIAKIKSMNAANKQAIANPQIVVDTFKLRDYASRLSDANRRISNLDGRMNSLYWKVGLLDLWDLVQANLLTGYSWRIMRAVSYLNNTASDFEKLETELVNKL